MRGPAHPGELLDHAPCGFLRLADDGSILLTNATLRELLGYPERALEGRHVDDVLTPGARIFYQTHVFPLVRVQGRVEEVYLSLRGRAGAEIPVLLNAVRRTHGEEAFSDWVVVVMRRRNQFEGELLQAKRAAQEASKAKDRFLSMLSHDLRTPLSGIKMASGLLAGGTMGPVTDQQREHLQQIQDASAFVLRLVEDLLAFARLKAGPTEVRTVAVSVEELLAQSASMVRHLVERAGLSLAVSVLPPGLHVLADPDRLQQVVLNLLTNAIKYTDAGGEVTLTAEAPDDDVLVHVRDTGTGIPEERLEQIFDPFVQLESSSSEGGSVGLGLAISRELVQKMGGDLTVDSRLGEGATFTIRLARAEHAPGEG